MVGKWVRFSAVSQKPLNILLFYSFSKRLCIFATFVGLFVFPPQIMKLTTTVMVSIIGESKAYVDSYLFPASLFSVLEINKSQGKIWATWRMRQQLLLEGVDMFCCM